MTGVQTCALPILGTVSQERTDAQPDRRETGEEEVIYKCSPIFSIFSMSYIEMKIFNRKKQFTCTYWYTNLRENLEYNVSANMV